MEPKSLLPLILLGLAPLAGCGADFDPYSRLKTPRVLALKSDPPAPGPGETATLSALTFLPAGQTASYAWSWCPAAGDPNQGYPCALEETQLRALLGGAEAPAYDLGTAPTATFAHSLPPAALEALCDRNPQTNQALGELAKFIDCKGGFAVQIRLVLRSQKEGGAVETVSAIRTLRLRFGAIPANANPTIDALWAVDPTMRIDDSGASSPALPRGKKTPIGAVARETDAETYQGEDDDGRPATVRERLAFSWFVETGDLKFGRTSFIDGQVPLDRATRNELQPELLKDYDRPASKVVVVIRDNRGGVGWASGLVNLEAK